MVLSLAATENIPIIEAKRKILQNTTVPKDITFDYNNFPILHSSNSAHSSNSSYNLHSYDSNISHNNRFSVLSLSNQTGGVTEGSQAINLPFNGSYRNNKQTYSRVISKFRDNAIRILINPHQKIPASNLNFSAHRDLLLSPNGRSSISGNNGIGYSTRTDTKPNLEGTNSSFASCHNCKKSAAQRRHFPAKRVCCALSR